MHCPFCRHSDSRVVDSRASDDGTSIRRRRQCPECGKRFTTAETVTITVTKRNGVTEPFSRAKVAIGVRKACQGRPVSDDDLAKVPFVKPAAGRKLTIRQTWIPYGQISGNLKRAVIVTNNDTAYQAALDLCRDLADKNPSVPGGTGRGQTDSTAMPRSPITPKAIKKPASSVSAICSACSRLASGSTTANSSPP